MRGLHSAGEPGLPRCGRYRAGGGFRRLAVSTGNPFRSVAAENRTEHLVAAPTDLGGGHRNRTPWTAHQHGRTPWLTAAASPNRAQLGPHYLPGANLPQSRITSECMEKR